MVNMPHWPSPIWRDGIYDLKNISLLLAELGHLVERLPPVIHIAGTNGKGSTQSYIRSIFEKAGYKVHSYTSPHLIHFNERIVLASEMISDQYLFEICEKTRLACEKLDLNIKFFEGITAAAFLAFSEIDADVLILETGMGGRLDATNIVPHPALTIITPISFDHMEYLGPTLPIIACEKGGIIKPGTPCVISAQTDDVYNVLSDICTKLHAPICAFEYDFGVEKIEDGFRIIGLGLDEVIFPAPSLPGDHQIINSASAIAGILNIKGFNISHNHLIDGIKNATWPGRLQKIKDGLWADCAHNESGAFVLSNWIREHLKSDVSLILGMTKNRDVLKFLEPFAGIVSHIFCVHIKSEASAYSAEKLAELAAASGIKTTACDSLQDALSLSSDIGNNRIVTGSIYLVADLIKTS